MLRSPEAIAVQAGEQQLSYRELNQQANQLAAAVSGAEEVDSGDSSTDSLVRWYRANR